MVDVVDLNGRRLTFHDRMRTFVWLGDVVADLLEVVRIGKIDNPNTGIEIGNPGDLVLKSIDGSVNGFRRLMRPEAASLVAIDTDWDLPG